MESNEKELIKEIQKNPKLFEKVFEEYYSKIFNYILRRVVNLQDAQDITSETFFTAFKKIEKFKFKNVTFGAWLYSIANKEIVNFYRKNNSFILIGKHKEMNDNYSVNSLNTNFELLEYQEKLKDYQDFLEIHEKIVKLPIKYQEVLTLKFFEGKSIKEICQILGKKEGTVKSLIHRGLKKLSEFIK